MKYIYLLLILSVVVLSGCSLTNPQIDCEEDSVTCSDGERLVRYAENECIFEECSDGRKYISNDPEQCMLMKFMCADDKKPFFDDQGCGCEPIGGKLQAFDCTDPRPEACTKEYMPVCGQVQVQCIKAPCPPIMETFGNKCTACANPLTISYTQGACAGDAAGGTVPADSENPCADIGGTYDSVNGECLGISQEQCQEIGGQFDECASACRNNPDAEVCTLQCVQVCNV